MAEGQVCIFTTFVYFPMNRFGTQYQSTNPFLAQSDVYRYGFQAQEQDRELWEGAVSFKYRVEDARLGRFFSVDPLVKRNVFYSPFAFSASKPITCIDFEGLEDVHYLDSFIKRQGSISIEVLEETNIGCDILEEFRNTDPEMCSGKVNIGYDAFVCASPLGDNVFGQTQAIFHPGSLIRDVDEIGSPYLRDGKEAILEAIENKSGSVWERMSTYFPDELLSSDEFKASIAEGKGIIIISINEELFNENEDTNNASIPSIAITVGHEFGAHAINIAHGIELTVEQEHGDFCGKESFYTHVISGSKEARLREQCEQVFDEMKSKK